MKKIKILIIICCMVWGFSNLLASYLPANFTNQGNPVLYKKMNKLGAKFGLDLLRNNYHTPSYYMGKWEK